MKRTHVLIISELIVICLGVVFGIIHFLSLRQQASSNSEGEISSDLVLKASSTNILTPFYRFEQLQGVDMRSTSKTSFLKPIPFYLTDPSLSFPYKTLTKAGVEVPFVSQFSIVRALGGLTSSYAGEAEDSSDLIQKNASTSAWLTHYDWFTNGLAPYLAAGYTPSDITIDLGNIPWDLSTNSCASGESKSGTYGNRTPISDYTEWGDFITGFIQSINSATNGHAQDFTYKIGVEYNSPESYCGSESDYEHYYASTATALEKVIPNPRMMPFEFTGNADTFTTDAIQGITTQKLPIVAVARSLNKYLNNGTTQPPSKVATMAQASFNSIYALPNVPHQLPHQIDQFGFDAGPVRTVAASENLDVQDGSWYFQTLFQLIEFSSYAHISHWNLFDILPVSGSTDAVILPTGTSWLYQILDNLLGATMSPVATELTPADTAINSYAMSFTKNNTLYILASTFSSATTSSNDVAHVLHITIPSSLLTTEPQTMSAIFVTDANTPDGVIKKYIASNSIPGASLVAPYSSSSEVGIVSSMIDDTPMPIHIVGSELSKSGPLRTAVLASIKNMFTLQLYVTSNLTKDSSNNYILSAPMEQNEEAIFAIPK